MKLNDEQELAANFRQGPCIVTACPGSGKTRTLVERTARLINSGVAPTELLCITFTNKAAAEMKERVVKRIGADAENIFIATFHRLASYVLRNYGDKLGYNRYMSILDDDGQMDLLSQGARQLGHELTKPALKSILWNTNDARENLENDDQWYERFKELDDSWYDISLEYIRRLRAANCIDFSGLLSETARIFTEHPSVLQDLQKQWRFFQVDEVQDTNYAQFKIVEMLAAQTKNVFVVGDLDQCQPAGTKVLTTSHGEVNIEELDENVHKLVSFSTRTSAVLGRKNGLSFSKAEQRKCDCFRTIIVDGKTTECTSNHKWTVKLKRDALHDYHAVYLQKKGDMWRVGRTALYRSTGRNGSGQFGPALRGRQEKADASWILKLCKTANEAQTWEQIISCKYGIPTVCFHSNKNFDLPTIYSNINIKRNGINYNLDERVQNCLTSHRLLINHPFWERRQQNISQDFGKRISLCVAACNLLPEIMQIPVPIGGKDFDWTDFSVETGKPTTKTVYSLSVERHKHYIANGIITHNSIYGWRGARAENIKDFQKLYPGTKIISLGKNYRSTPQIVAVADKLIRCNAERIAADFTTDNPAGTPVKVQPFNYDKDEAAWVAQTIKATVENGRCGYKDIAIFYRINSMSRAIEMAMINNDIPHTLIGGFSFFDRKVVKDCVAMLRFLVNPTDSIAFHRICNKPKRSIGDVTVGKIETFAQKNNMNVLDACGNMKFTSESVMEGLGELRRAFTFDFRSKSIAESLEHILKGLRYREFLEADPETAVDHTQNLDEMIADAAKFGVENGNKIEAYLDHIALMSNYDKTADGNAVSLMTLHASKGLEFPIVFMLGVEHEILPHKMAVSERADGIEEERRLCYVGMTRAEKVLTITYCTHRQENSFARAGQVRYKASRPSQFLFESGLLQQKKAPEPSRGQNHFA